MAFDPAFDIEHTPGTFPPAFDLSGIIPPVAESRYFTTLLASAQKHYTIPEVILSGDYSISALVYKPTGAQVRVYGNTSGFTSRLIINADGSINFRADISADPGITAGAGTVADNALHTITVTRSGNTGSIIVNGTTVATGSVPVANAAVGVIGRQSTSYGDGIIANVKITNNGTVVRNYPINESWDGSTVLRDVSGNGQDGTAVNITSSDAELFDQVSDGWTGVELWSIASAVATGNATLSGNGARFDLDAGESASYRLNGVLSTGNIYKAEFNIAGYTAGDVADGSSGFNTIGITGNRDYSFTTDPVTSGDAIFFRAGPSCHYNVNDVSWKRFLEVA